MRVAALFVETGGIYFNLPGVDPWDTLRDARTYTGNLPVVAHPPCFLWVNLAAVNWKRYARQKPAWYPGGSDDGCFLSALRSVYRCGGVLEHPAGSWAWKTFGLARPEGIGWRRGDGGYVCEVWQSAYGHGARKRTWLFANLGHRPPELRWDRPAGTHQVGWFDRVKPTLSKRDASRTPREFASELIALARTVRRERS